MAILRHALPDGSAHFDLLLAGDEVPDEERRVPTWRCPMDPLSMPVGSCMAIESLPAHRGLYLRLSCECALDGDRGTVTPLHRGWHIERQGLLWLATDSIAPRAFGLQRDSLRREPGELQVNAS
jgi:hypothetical protein